MSMVHFSLRDIAEGVPLQEQNYLNCFLLIHTDMHKFFSHKVHTLLYIDRRRIVMFLSSVPSFFFKETVSREM
jgi:hypothetical protein